MVMVLSFLFRRSAGTGGSSPELSFCAQGVASRKPRYVCPVVVVVLCLSSLGVTFQELSVGF